MLKTKVLYNTTYYEKTSCIPLTGHPESVDICYSLVLYALIVYLQTVENTILLNMGWCKAKLMFVQHSNNIVMNTIAKYVRNWIVVASEQSLNGT